MCYKDLHMPSSWYDPPEEEHDDEETENEQQSNNQGVKECLFGKKERS